MNLIFFRKAKSEIVIKDFSTAAKVPTRQANALTHKSYHIFCAELPNSSKIFSE
jgi:hypothetical protein